MELPEGFRAQLLDPQIWEEGLRRFVTATNVAVLLTDTEGRPLGQCLNARPTWSILRNQKPTNLGECPFCIEPAENGTNCVIDALETARTVTTCDSSGLVHLAIPLFLFDEPMGALIAGQVFDRYPNSLQLHNLARKLDISSDKLWHSARLEYPMRRETLHVYGSLLETLGSTFLEAVYQRLTDAERLSEMARLHGLSKQLELQQRELAAERARQIRLTARALDETRTELGKVTNRLVSAQEEERERMARELHDGIGHGIVLFQFDMHALRQMIPSKLRHQVDPQLNAISDRIRQIADEVRELSHDLHPSVLKDLGLEEAVRQLGQNVQKHHSFRVEFSAKDIPDPMDSAVSLGLYRIAQEAIQNVVKHAGPTRVSIALSAGKDSVEVSITDNGTGFDPAAPKRGLGLINMTHRAESLGGTFELSSVPGKGTKIRLRVPLRNGHDAA